MESLCIYGLVDNEYVRTYPTLRLDCQMNLESVDSAQENVPCDQ